MHRFPQRGSNERPTDYSTWFPKCPKQPPPPGPIKITEALVASSRPNGQRYVVRDTKVRGFMIAINHRRDRPNLADELGFCTRVVGREHEEA